jgi:hypothetical protein
MKQKHTVLYRLSLSQPLQSVSLVWSKGKFELEYQLFLSAAFVPARVGCGKPSPAFFLWGSIAFILLLYEHCQLNWCHQPHVDCYHITAITHPTLCPGVGCLFWFLKTVQAQTHRGQAVTHYPITPFFFFFLYFIKRKSNCIIKMSLNILWLKIPFLRVYFPPPTVIYVPILVLVQ